MKGSEEQEAKAASPSQEAVTEHWDVGDGTSELARVLDGYLADCEAGRSPDRTRLLAAHPHLAPQLEQALAGLEFIQQATGRMAEAPAQLGDFRLLREVGRGGMGVVYEAEQISLKRRVALKVLRFGAVADEVAMQRFQREAETVARLHHTNIVPIFAVGSAEGVRYYAMQFIEGLDLAERLRVAREMQDPIQEREIADWGLQAAEALAHAHQRGVIHRDIKPSNLICDREGRVWLTDFGLARRMDDAALSAAGSLLGTPRYMSPEQARAAKDPVDHRTDLYSLGATLYELATRRPIFEAATAHEVIAQILHADPESPRALSPGLAHDLETIILKCLAKAPADRYPTAQALAEDLRAFLAGRPISARPPSLPERMMRWMRRHRRSTGVAAISAGVGMVLVAGGLLGWQQHQESRLGRLALSAAGPNVVAEVLDADGQLVTPTFPIPTPAPVSLPAGTYQVRLSASGMLSETWPVEIQPRQIYQDRLYLRPRWLWPPRELKIAEYPETEIVDLGSSVDLLVMSYAAVAAGTRHPETLLELVRGATGEPVWEQPLRFDETTLPVPGSLEEWKRLFVWNVGSPFLHSGLAERARDLDGDGTRDLVLVSRNSPSLLAVSGRTGAVLWWFRGLLELPADGSTAGARLDRRSRGSMVGRPAVADVDGDGTPDFIACFRSEGDTYTMPDGGQRHTGALSWIGAVSGSTGADLWRQPLAARWEQYANSSGEREKYDELCRPAVAQVDGRPVVVLVVGPQLFGWEVATGRPAWTSIDLGYAPIHAPQVADLDADGVGEVLLLRHEEAEMLTVDLLALALPGGKVEWTRSVARIPRGQVRDLNRRERVLMPLADLDSDGRPEIVTLTVQQARPMLHVFGLEVLEGATGRPRWTQRLGFSRFVGVTESVQKVVPGPDLDGDGHRELFAAWRAHHETTRQQGLYVTALSGRNGAAFWRAHLSGADLVRTLEWWHSGTDGWPLLLVGVDHAVGGQKMTYVMAGSSGRVEHVLPDVAEPQVADFDRDGIPDLAYTVSPQGAPRQLVIRGLPPEPWRRSGDWHASEDLDGDGDTDLVSMTGGRLTARSGRDGHWLWSTPFELQDHEPVLLPQSPADDLDRDGVPDLIVAMNLWRKGEDRARSSYRTLAACSGRDGRLLWAAEDWEFGTSSESGSRVAWSYKVPVATWGGQVGKGSTGVLIVHQPNDQRLRLTHLAGPDGRLLWSLPILRGGFMPSPSPSGPPLADFNGDGVSDVALWSPDSGGQDGQSPYGLMVFDGHSGQPLWSSLAVTVADESQVVWPEPVVGDLDGDGWPEVIGVMHRGFDGQHLGYPCELVVVDGRTGRVRWTWSWRTGFPDLWPPLVLPGGPSGARLCLGVREESFTGLVVIDANGQVQLRRPVKLAGNSFDAGRLVWRVLDLDHDGHGHLVYLDEGRVTLAGGDALDVRWQWPVSSDVALMWDPLDATAGLPATLPLWTGRDVVGLDLVEGTPRWRGHVAAESQRHGSNPPELRLLASTRLNGLPRFQATARGAGLVGQVWPAASNGQYLAPAPEPRQVTGLPGNPFPKRPWPWAERLLVTITFLSGAATMLLLGLPVLLVREAVKRRSWLLGIVPVLYAGLSVLWFHQGAAAVVALGFAGWLLSWSRRSRTGWLAAVAVLYAVLALFPFLVVAPGHVLDGIHPWGAWWWVDEMIGEPLVIAIAGLPPLLAWLRIVAALRRWDGLALGRWIGGTVLAAVILAVVALLFDQQHKLPEESYAWHGWYGILFAGLYVAGCFGLLELGWQTARRHLRSLRLLPSDATRIM